MYCLKEDACETEHFVYVTPEVWEFFKKEYGGGEPVFKRENKKNATGSRSVWLRPLYLNLVIYKEDGTYDLNTDPSSLYPVMPSKTPNDIFWQVKKEKSNMDTKTRCRVPFRCVKEKDYAEATMIDGFDHETIVELSRESKCWEETLESLGFKQGDTFLFEFEKSDKWPSSKTFKFEDLTLGSQCVGYDQYNKWYHMQVVGEKMTGAKKELHCHWLGFKASWNEWIDSSDNNKFKSIGSESVDYKWWPKKQYNNNRSSSAAFSSRTYGQTYSRHAQGTSAAEGVVGLRNLGNTCFMNSVLQCLNQAPYLHEYFVKNIYKKELNFENVLGHKGKMATEWANLTQLMWSNKYTMVVPHEFKRTIGEINQTFVGFAQQDSQELLTFLLDGLHEDLNRVKKKPYVEAIESDGRKDEIVAAESWTNFMKRNNSVLTDLTHGQLKSRVQCPKCDRISITFDPFCCLSLPIPTDDSKLQIITYIPYNPPSDFVPVSYGIKINKTASVKDLKSEVVKKLKLENTKIENLWVCDVYNGKVHTLLKDDQCVRRLQNPTSDDIFIFEVKPYNNIEKSSSAEGVRPYRIYNRKPGVYEAYFGIPLAVCVDLSGKWSKEDLEAHIHKTIAPYVNKESMDTEERKYELKWTDDRLSSDPREWSKFDEQTCQAILLCWKNTDDYNQEHSKWHSRKKHNSCEEESSRPKLKVETCLDSFTKTETLQDDNLWYCNKCKTHREAKKQCICGPHLIY
eukprot:UN30376